MRTVEGMPTHARLLLDAFQRNPDASNRDVAELVSLKKSSAVAWKRFFYKNNLLSKDREYAYGSSNHKRTR